MCHLPYHLGSNLVHKLKISNSQPFKNRPCKKELLLSKYFNIHRLLSLCKCLLFQSWKDINRHAIWKNRNKTKWKERWSEQSEAYSFFHYTCNPKLLAVLWAFSPHQISARSNSDIRNSLTLLLNFCNWNEERSTTLLNHLTFIFFWIPMKP